MAAFGESLTALDVYNKCAVASALVALLVLSSAHSSCNIALLGREFATADGKQLKLSSLAGVPVAVSFMSRLSCSLVSSPRLPCSLLPDSALFLCQESRWSFSSFQKLRRLVRSQYTNASFAKGIFLLCHNQSRYVTQGSYRCVVLQAAQRRSYSDVA